MEQWQHHQCEIINWACHIETNLGLRAGRDFFHPDAILMGGFDNRACGILHWGNEEQIKAYTHRLLDEAGPEKLILSSDCSVQPGTPVSHLRWVMEACQTHALKR